MVQTKKLTAIALVGLLTGAAATADDWGYYRPEPQIRLGFDVVWGGYGYAPPPPVVVWSPPAYQPYPYYAPYYAPVRGPERGYGRGHHKHKHHRDHWDD